MAPHDRCSAEDLLRIRLAEETEKRRCAELDVARLLLIQARREQEDLGREIRGTYGIAPSDEIAADGTIVRKSQAPPLAAVPST